MMQSKSQKPQPKLHIDARSPIGDVIADPKFLEAGGFLQLPDELELPRRLYVAHESGDQIKSIRIEAAASPLLEAIGESMTGQWDFIYDRVTRQANTGTPDTNTLTRYVYNTFSIRQIIQNLEERDVPSARVLLVTAYETPIQELLEFDRVSKVLAVDLSRKACGVVSAKYACHTNAAKLHLRLLDYSGLDPQFQEDEIAELVGELSADGLGSDVLTRHFARIGSGQYLIPLDLESDSFDAIHLPFVLGSLHLTPMTAVIARYRDTMEAKRIDYEDFIGSQALVTKEAQKSVLTVMNHALQETCRILKPGGVVIINLWARPLPDAPGMVRLSDVAVPASALSDLLDGYQHLFSGNPQPNLPHTVGHILKCLKIGHKMH